MKSLPPEEKEAGSEEGYSWGKFLMDVFNVSVIITLVYLVLRKTGVIK